MKEKMRKRKDTEKIESKGEKENQSRENKGKKGALEQRSSRRDKLFLFLEGGGFVVFGRKYRPPAKIQMHMRSLSCFRVNIQYLYRAVV
jgi:hypothetical protein